MSQYLFFLLILACPLMMVFMMRGGHGHGAHGHGGHGHGAHGNGGQGGHAHMGADEDGDPPSVDDLKRRREELDREISLREGR